jgi:hypothetical protein
LCLGTRGGCPAAQWGEPRKAGGARALAPAAVPRESKAIRPPGVRRRPARTRAPATRRGGARPSRAGARAWGVNPSKPRAGARGRGAAGGRAEAERLGGVHPSASVGTCARRGALRLVSLPPEGAACGGRVGAAGTGRGGTGRDGWPHGGTAPRRPAPSLTLCEAGLAASGRAQDRGAAAAQHHLESGRAGDEGRGPTSGRGGGGGGACRALACSQRRRCCAAGGFATDAPAACGRDPNPTPARPRRAGRRTHRLRVGEHRRAARARGGGGGDGRACARRSCCAQGCPAASQPQRTAAQQSRPGCNPVQVGTHATRAHVEAPLALDVLRGGRGRVARGEHRGRGHTAAA